MLYFLIGGIVNTWSRRLELKSCCPVIEKKQLSGIDISWDIPSPINAPSPEISVVVDLDTFPMEDINEEGRLHNPVPPNRAPQNPNILLHQPMVNCHKILL